MFQFNSNPLQLNLDHNIPGSTRPKEEYSEETVVAEPSSSFSDMVYNYNTNGSFSSFDSGAESLGYAGLSNGSQLCQVEQPSVYPFDYSLEELNTVPFSDSNTRESSTSVQSYQPSLPLLAPEGEQYIDTRLLNMPCELPQPPFPASADAISPVVSDQFTWPIPTAFGQEHGDSHTQYATAQASLMDAAVPMHLNQQPAYGIGELSAPVYNVRGEPATATGNLGQGAAPVASNVHGAILQASYSLNTFISTYPKTSVVYGVTAPGKAPATVTMTTASTSTHVEGPSSAPAVALPVPAPKSAKRRSRPRKTKSSLSTTRKHVKASAPTSKVPCLFPGCMLRFYDEKTRQRHASTHNEIRPGFFCPGMYLPRVDCAKCNCHETGYTREDALVRHLKSIEPFNPCVLEAERLGWSANVKGSAKNLRGYRPVKPAIAGADAES